MAQEVSVLKVGPARQIVTDAEDARDAAQEAAGNAAGFAISAETYADRAEDARDAALEAVAVDYYVALTSDLAGLSPTSGQTAWVIETGHFWHYDGAAWQDDGEGFLAGKADASDLAALDNAIVSTPGPNMVPRADASGQINPDWVLPTGAEVLVEGTPGDVGGWTDLGERITTSAGRVKSALTKFDVLDYFDGVPGALFDLTNPANMRQGLDGTGSVTDGDPVRWIEDPISGQVALLEAGDPRTYEVVNGRGRLSDGDGIYRTPDTPSASLIDLRTRTGATFIFGIEIENAPGDGNSAPGGFDSATGGSSGTIRLVVPSGSSQFQTFVRGTSGATAQLTANPSLTLPRRAVVAVVADFPSQTVRLYLDGDMIAEDIGTIGAAAEMNRWPFTIGGASTLTAPFAGAISFAAIIGEALTGDDLKKLTMRVSLLTGVPQSSLAAPGVIANSTTITVGPTGDFPALIPALESLGGRTRQWQSSDDMPTIELQPAFVLAEQIHIESYDWSWLDITSSAEIDVDTTGFANGDDDRDSRPLFNVQNGGRLPFIKCIFNFVGGLQSCGVLLNRGSMGVIADGCGFVGFHDNAIANNNSELVARFSVLKNATRWCAHIRHNSRGSLRSCDLTNINTSGTYGVYADRVSIADARRADMSGNAYGIDMRNGSTGTVLGAVAQNCGNYSGAVRAGSFLSGAGTYNGDAGFDTTGSGAPFNQDVNILTPDGCIFSAV